MKETEDPAEKQTLQAELNERYLQILYSNPCGFRITARMTTNYRQLKTIYRSAARTGARNGGLSAAGSKRCRAANSSPAKRPD